MITFRMRVPTPLQRVGLFALMPALSLLSNVVVLPVVSSSFGTAGWTSILLGQSVGAAASVVAALQWPTEGPTLMSREERGRHAAIYRASFISRTIAVLACCTASLSVLWIAAPADLVVSAMACIGATLNALSPSWYFIGRGEPLRLVRLEGIPRLLGSVLAIVLIVSGAPLWSYGLILVTTPLFTAAISAYVILRGRDRSIAWRNSSTRSAVGYATLARTLDAGYSFSMGPIVALVAPMAYPVFGACDRLAKIAQNGLDVVPQGTVRWVAEPETTDGIRTRVRKLSHALVGVAALVWILATVLTPTAVRLLFAGTITVGILISSLVGAVVGAVFLIRALLLAGLTPLGAVKTGYRYLIAGSAVGVPALITGAIASGAAGALGGVALSALAMAMAMYRRIVTMTRKQRGG